MRHTLIKLLACCLLVPGIAAAQVNSEAYKDYFLVGQFGEVCTMCEVIVLCEAGTVVPEYEAVPLRGSFTLYHVQTRTFWSQMSTIWEWFVSNFSDNNLAARGHTRPVFVHEVTDGNWAPRRVEEARLVLEPGVIEFGEQRVDRVTRGWYEADAETTSGFCQRLPLWDALDVIAANAPATGDES